MEVGIDKNEITITNTRRSYYELNLGYKIIELNFGQLLSFRKKILTHSSKSNIEYLLDHDNFVLVFAADNKHLLYLDVPQLLRLRKVLLSVFEHTTVV